jgi:uncharacterized membrane protein
MSLRTWRERACQSIVFELGGIVLAVPAYAMIFGQPAAESLVLVLALSLAVLIWTPLHNWAFDTVEWRLTGRVASDRRTGLRLVHAASHEVTSMILTLPLLMTLGGHGLAEAILVDLGFSAFYAGYALVFYWAWDHISPVRPGPLAVAS